MQAKLDDVTLSVIQSSLQQVCNEMDLAFQRAAFSPTISETMDRSDGIYHPNTGELIAQGEWGMPIFVGCMRFSTQAALEYIRKHNIPVEEGDVFMFNDPYMGGTHVMDVKFLRPYFHAGKIFAWFSNTGHWPDCGGMVPSGFSSNATEIEQEGLRLPPVKIFKRDEIDFEIVSIVLSNVRVSEERIGDIKAQIGALTVGERRFGEIIERYGVQVVSDCIDEFRKRAAQLMRSRIADIPDGSYEGIAYVDSDGIKDEPLQDLHRLAQGRNRTLFRSIAIEPAMRWPYEQCASDHEVGGLSRREAPFPRTADQRGYLRAHSYQGS